VNHITAHIKSWTLPLKWGWVCTFADEDGIYHGSFRCENFIRKRKVFNKKTRKWKVVEEIDSKFYRSNPISA
jgi:hypothetical protein